MQHIMTNNMIASTPLKPSFPPSSQQSQQSPQTFPSSSPSYASQQMKTMGTINRQFQYMGQSLNPSLMQNFAQPQSQPFNYGGMMNTNRQNTTVLGQQMNINQQGQNNIQRK